MWNKYELHPKESDEVPMEDFKDGTKVCAYDSEFDRRNPTTKKLYYDLAQLEAGIDTVYGVKRDGILSEDWNGHKKGSYVLVVYFQYDIAKGPDYFRDIVLIHSP